MSMDLKFVYRYKQVIFGDNIGTSKYNISPWGPKRDKEGVVKSTITDSP